MIIGIIPTIREIYTNQFEFCFDIRLHKFLKTINKNCKIKILTEIKNIKFDLLCLAGGNDIKDKSKKAIIRNKLDSYYYLDAKRKGLPILGICHGAQFIAKKEGARIVFKKQRIKKHKIYSKKKYLNNKIVNSYHNLLINKLSSNMEKVAFDGDKNIECFKIKNSRILGIIWHPERYKNFKVSDIRLIKEIL